MRSDWLSGGSYHGPSNEAGMTGAEYRETMDEYYAEREDAWYEARYEAEMAMREEEGNDDE